MFDTRYVNHKDHQSDDFNSIEPKETEEDEQLTA